MTQGKNTDRNMIVAFAFRSIPTKTTTTGIQAMGGTGRSNSNTGRTNLSTGVNHPMKSPRGMPMTRARKKPLSATWRLATMLVPRVFPSGFLLLIL